jgi:hypothetical protein
VRRKGTTASGVLWVCATTVPMLAFSQELECLLDVKLAHLPLRRNEQGMNRCPI